MKKPIYFPVLKVIFLKDEQLPVKYIEILWLKVSCVKNISFYTLSINKENLPTKS